MSGDAEPSDRGDGALLPRWLFYALMLGCYLSLRGYHSLDGDQAYRLPLLLHQQDPRVYADDPFVQAFDAFNPHRGSLMVLDLMIRPLGLSAGLFATFMLTFGATCLGVDRLARAVWPATGSMVGLIAVALVFAAKAGNIGTNHLFEAMVLDRLMAFALGWLAIAYVVAEPERGWTRTAAAIALATLIHPAVGLQLAIMLGASLITWCLLGRWMEVGLRTAFVGVVGLAVAVVPGLVVNLAPGSSLLGDMPARDFWLLTAELQSPQHMLPHLWRMPQWLAWACYPALAAWATAGIGRRTELEPIGNLSPARLRLMALLAIILLWLGASWYSIEVRHDLRVTIFQPFRMATIARGIALVLVAGRLVALWRSGGWLGRQRATLLSVAFVGDWLLVVVTLAELTVSAVEAIRSRVIDAAAYFGMLSLGFHFLAHHDTEYGNRTLLMALSIGLIVGCLSRGRSLRTSREGEKAQRIARMNDVAEGHILPIPFFAPLRLCVRFPTRFTVAVVAAWVVPLAALLATAIPLDHPASRHPLVRSLINRCRFAAVPVDDVERLAVWCRDHTPSSARFIGPPGPKTFRLWSLRNLAFNRAASPYNAAGLADWFSRFQEHVNFHGTPSEFVHAYLADRHGFESRYQALTDSERAALALRQGATYVVAAAPGSDDRRTDRGALELLHVEGRYAVYQVKLARLPITDVERISRSH